MKYLIETALCKHPTLPMNQRILATIALWLAAQFGALTYPLLAQGQRGGRANEDQPISGLINPRAVEFSPATGKVYTVDPDSNAITIGDDESGRLASVKVGSSPVSIAANSQNGNVYVVNAGDGTVSIVDGHTDAVVTTVKVGIHPYSITVNSMTGKVYVSHTFNSLLTIIDGATNGATNIKTGSADLISVDTKTGIIYLLGYEGGSLKLMNGADSNIIERTVGMHAWGMTLNETTGTLYVAKPGYSQLAILTPSSSTPMMVPTGAIPCAVAVNSVTNRIYVLNYADDSVTVIDGVNNHPVATVPVGRRPQAIAIDPTRNRIYVANTHSNSITVIDGESNRVLSTLPAGKSPYALAVNVKAGKLHVANLDKTPFTIIDLRQISKTAP